jgi:hypothetical protein
MTQNFKQRIPVSKDFFCDGHCYLLTSQSFGGSGLAPEELSEIMLKGDESKIKPLVERGVCMPVCFEGDCALDGGTWFVLGDLSEQEEQSWIARLAWKLSVPCGRLILCCGCCEDELVPIAAGEPPPEHYKIYESIDVPPGEYLVEIYAYLSSLTVQVALDDFDEDEDDDEETATFKKGEKFLQTKHAHEWLRENRPEIDGVDYIIRLAPLTAAPPPMPKLNDGWFEKFEFRDAVFR